MAFSRVTDLCKFVIRRFVLHASIVQPLGEGGKLKLTTDCTSLEFALSQLLSDYKLNLAALGDDFKALRAFRLVGFSVILGVAADGLVLYKASTLPRECSLEGCRQDQGCTYPSAATSHPGTDKYFAPASPGAQMARGGVLQVCNRAYNTGEYALDRSTHQRLAEQKGQRRSREQRGSARLSKYSDGSYRP